MLLVVSALIFMAVIFIFNVALQVEEILKAEKKEAEKIEKIAKAIKALR